MALAILSHAVNLIVAGLLPFVIAAGRPSVEMVYGPDSAARRILACLYGTIAAASGVALLAKALGWEELFIAITLVLFSMQIVYKLATWPAVGLGSPVVRA
ncbi:MAG: hypothetical protein AAFY03_01485, partial [Pseudomonadota bacterium]